MTFTETQTAQIAEDAAAALVSRHDIDREDGETAIQALAWSLGDGPLTYEAGLTTLVHEAIQIAVSQSPTIIGSDERDLEVGVWPAHPDMAADGGPDAIVVQIDTGESTGRLRVNINDAGVWDGDPQTDRRPGAWFHTEPSAGATESSIALSTISIEDLQTLVDAADKWSTELDDYVIPSATESSAEDAASYTAQMEQIDNALSRVRALLVSAHANKTETNGASADDEGNRDG